LFSLQKNYTVANNHFFGNWIKVKTHLSFELKPFVWMFRVVTERFILFQPFSVFRNDLINKSFCLFVCLSVCLFVHIQPTRRFFSGFCLQTWGQQNELKKNFSKILNVDINFAFNYFNSSCGNYHLHIRSEKLYTWYDY
jgi:hypothetical protein